MEPGKKRFAFIGCGGVAYYHADVILSHGHQIVGVSARPNSKKIGQETVSIPLSPALSKIEVNKIIKSIKQIIKN